MKQDRIFYLHIPKTAGSSMNKFLSLKYNEKEILTHIESSSEFRAAIKKNKISRYNFISGHVVLPQMIRDLDVFNTMTTVATFRRPIEHVISHISWVRKLGEPGEEKRLETHTPDIKLIVKKLLETDLSNPSDIRSFIEWLEKERLYLFHNTQTKYLCGGTPGVFSPQLINQALINLKKIDYVGTVERMDDFYLLLAGSLGLKVNEGDIKKENANGINYGLDITDAEIIQALQPFIGWDNMIYRIVRERFIDDLHSFLVVLEKNKFFRFSTVRKIPPGICFKSL